MPKIPNNRVHGETALQTHDIWSKTIGYDPYAPKKETEEIVSQPSINTFQNFRGLLALARLTGGNNTDTKSLCKKCGGGGHLTFQCRNFLQPQLNKTIKEENFEEEKENSSSLSSSSESSSEEDRKKKKKRKEKSYSQTNKKRKHSKDSKKKKKKKKKEKK